jgi:hypothetical protein
MGSTFRSSADFALEHFSTRLSFQPLFAPFELAAALRLPRGFGLIPIFIRLIAHQNARAGRPIKNCQNLGVSEKFSDFLL